LLFVFPTEQHELGKAVLVIGSDSVVKHCSRVLYNFPHFCALEKGPRLVASYLLQGVLRATTDQLRDPAPHQRCYFGLLRCVSWHRLEGINYRVLCYLHHNRVFESPGGIRFSDQEDSAA